MSNSRVPKFGDWGSAAEAGYTVCFDQARKGRVVAPMATPVTGAPNDLGGERNPNLGKSYSPSRARGGEREGRGALRTRDEKTPTKADIGYGGGEVRRFSNFPPVNPYIAGGNTDRRRPSAVTGFAPQEQGQRTAQSYSSHSPRHDKANVVAGSNQKGHHGVGGHTNEKYSGRPTRRPGTGGAAVPKFGDWNMNARAVAGDGGYTVIFNQARAEKHKGQSPAALDLAAVHPDSLRNKSSATGNRHRGCCLPWGRSHHYP